MELHGQFCTECGEHFNTVDYLQFKCYLCRQENETSEATAILRSVTDSFCAIGRAEEYDTCKVWETNGGDCKGCGYYIAHNER